MIIRDSAQDYFAFKVEAMVREGELKGYSEFMMVENRKMRG